MTNNFSSSIPWARDVSSPKAEAYTCQIWAQLPIPTILELFQCEADDAEMNFNVTFQPDEDIP